MSMLHRLTGLDGRLEVYPDRLVFPAERLFISIRDLVEVELQDGGFLFHTHGGEHQFEFDESKAELAARIRDTIDKLLWEKNKLPEVRMVRKKRTGAKASVAPGIVLGSIAILTRLVMMYAGYVYIPITGIDLFVTLWENARSAQEVGFAVDDAATAVGAGRSMFADDAGDAVFGDAEGDALPDSMVLWFGNGMYKVGNDLESGIYYLEAISDWGGYYAVRADSTGNWESLLFNDFFKANSFVRVEDGEYLEVSGARFTLADNVEPMVGDGYGTGVYRVGYDLPAGEYRLLPTDDLGGYYKVSYDCRGAFDILTNDLFYGPTYLTVSEGQFLTLNDAEIISGT